MFSIQISWLTKTDPRDVARVESKTFISTPKKSDTIPTPRDGVKGTLGNWMSPEDMDKAIDERFPGCMRGRTMYVIPFSMGPVGSPLSKIGIQLTDSPYVAASTRIMTRMGQHVLDLLGDGDFIKATHSVGQPLPMKEKLVQNWPCNPEKTIVAHIPANNEIVSFGSGKLKLTLAFIKNQSLTSFNSSSYRIWWQFIAGQKVFRSPTRLYLGQT